MYIFIQSSLTSVSHADKNTSGMTRKLDRIRQSNQKTADPPPPPKKKKKKKKNNPEKPSSSLSGRFEENTPLIDLIWFKVHHPEEGPTVK
jgi:hypothetical protein